MMKLITLLVFASALHGQVTGHTSISGNYSSSSVSSGSLSVTVVGTSNTQAVLAYTAPDSNPCHFQASESATLSPPVYDVDTSMFGTLTANSDARDSGISNGTSRIVVLGARLSQPATDTNIYSRALQANTLHYYQVTCGSATATGTFTTADIPFGMTYQDIPQLDPTTPGATITPTLSATDRTQTVVDAHTGVQISRVSLPGDTVSDGGGGTGPYMYSGGFVPVCSDILMDSPPTSYLCAAAQGNGGYGVLYSINATTRAATYLGAVWGIAYPYINPTDGKFYTSDGTNVVMMQYTGDFTGVASGVAASFSSPTTILSGLPTAIHSFDSAFNTAHWSCTGGIAAGDYLHIQCLEGGADSLGWLVTVKLSTGTLVAATRVDSNIKCRWCAVHQTITVPADLVVITTHDPPGGPSTPGRGPYTTTYAGGSTLAIGSSTITVSGEPGCSACGTDPELPVARVGDVFKIGADTITITVKNSSTQWTFTPVTTQTHAPGDTISTSCSYTPIFWKFLADPHGTDTTNTNFVADSNWPGGGHDAYAASTYPVQATGADGWAIRTGDLMTSVGQALTRTIPDFANFAGAAGQCYGDGCKLHPSSATGQPWLTDYVGWDGSYYNNYASTWTPVTGQLYKYAPFFPINPKHFAIAGSTGTPYNGVHAFLDVSGPSVTLGTTSADQYKMCIAEVAGECYSTSSAGDVYANLPGSPTGCVPNGPCIANFAAYAGGVAQVGLSGTQTRILTGGLTGLRDTNDYPNAHAVANGTGIIFPKGDVQYNTPGQLLLLKAPPFSAGDSVDRSTFVRAPISITTPSGLGIASATVEFGYLEQGTVAQKYCTSRRETCVVVASTVTDATPFWFETTDFASSLYTRAPCISSCTITLPVLPMHVAYYQVKFYDAGGTFVTSGASGVAIEGTVH
jgi:hypothetical protein